MNQALNTQSSLKKNEAEMACPCQSSKDFVDCCEPLILGTRKAETAEELIRSRYTAYAKGDIAYIIKTIHPKRQKDYEEEGIRQWSENSQWQGFEIVSKQGGEAGDQDATVEFIAKYLEAGKNRVHHEIASFKKLEDTWFFEDGKMAPTTQFSRAEAKIGRNDPCSCGSGKKFKKCHGA